MRWSTLLSALLWPAERRPGDVINRPDLTGDREDEGSVIDDFERGRPVQTLGPDC
jgi:hypothetical protein